MIFDQLEKEAGHLLTPISYGPGYTDYLCENCCALFIINTKGQLLLFHGLETEQHGCNSRAPAEQKLREKLHEMLLELAKH